MLTSHKGRLGVRCGMSVSALIGGGYGLAWLNKSQIQSPQPKGEEGKALAIRSQGLFVWRLLIQLTRRDPSILCEVFALVTDLNMRELDGLVLLRGAKALRPHVPVILFSSQVDARLAAQAIAMGAHDVLPKPFNREEFITALTLALNTYALAREVRTRRLMTGRLSKRVADIKRLIAEGQGRPNTIRRIQEQVSASRQLNIKSVATLESSLDRLWHRAQMAQARLDEAQQRLLIRQQENIEACLKRNWD